MVKSTKSKTAKTAKGSKSQTTKAATKATTKTATTKTETKATSKSATKSTPKTTTKATPKAETKPVEEKVTKKRVVDKDSILTDFDTILSQLDDNVSLIRENKSTTKSPINIKDIRGIQKQLRQLRSDVNRQIRNKRKLSTEQIASSGFMKPVKISGDMCKFAGWKVGDMHSRVDVTKFICGYIREKDLQNPKDRRQIKADETLSKLLKLDKNSSEPLTYYSLQRHIQQHFVTA